MKMLMRVHMVENQPGARERGKLRPNLRLQLSAQRRQCEIPHAIQPHPVAKAPLAVDEIRNLLPRQHREAIREHEMQPNPQLRQLPRPSHRVRGSRGAYHQARRCQDSRLAGKAHRLVDGLVNAEIIAAVEVSEAAQLAQAGLLEPLNTTAVTNISLVAPVFRKGFPWGIPTDLGKMGIGYRSDLIPERPTSWHELWQLAKKYSGKLTVVNYDADIQGTALKYCGYSVNTKSMAQLQAMQKALLDLKPHIQSLTDTDHAKPLIEGTAVLAMDYDYDLVVAQQSNKNIVWVAPTEGMTAYLEGWVALKDSKHLAAAFAFMNFHLAPRNYASFINANGPAYVEPATAKYIKPVYANAPALKYSLAALKNVEFEGYLGPQQVAYRAKLWEEFIAS